MGFFDKDKALNDYNREVVGNLNQMLNSGVDLKVFDKSVWKEVRECRELLRIINRNIVKLIERNGKD